MTQTIEQLTARIAELEEENTALVKTIQRDTLTSLRRLAALKAELREICDAIDDPACDLTLTTVECIKKLKGENEWQPIETAPTDGTAILVCHEGGTWIAKHKAVYQSGYEPDNPWFCLMLNKDHIPARKRKGYPTHWMPLPKPPAMAQGEK